MNNKNIRKFIRLTRKTVLGTSVSVILFLQAAHSTTFPVWGNIPNCSVFLDASEQIIPDEKGTFQTNSVGAIAISQWIGGFMSGYYMGTTSLDKRNTLVGVQFLDLWRWIDAYCRDHRSNHLVDALHEFTNKSE